MKIFQEWHQTYQLDKIPILFMAITQQKTTEVNDCLPKVRPGVKEDQPWPMMVLPKVGPRVKEDQPWPMDDPRSRPRTLNQLEKVYFFRDRIPSNKQIYYLFSFLTINCSLFD